MAVQVLQAASRGTQLLTARFARLAHMIARPRRGFSMNEIGL